MGVLKGRTKNPMGRRIDELNAWADTHPVIAYWVPAILYAFGIFSLSSFSRPPTPPGAQETPFFAEYAHFFEYMFFGIILYVAFSSLKNVKLGYRAPALAIITGVLYGASDEFHQTFVPGRSGTISDFLVDCLGVATAQLIFGIWYNIKLVNRQ